MDIRSFALNAEINVLIYDRQLVERLKEVQDDYFKNSDELTLADWQKRSVLQRVVQITARLIDYSFTVRRDEEQWSAGVLRKSP